MKLEVILWGIPQAMRACAAVFPKFAESLKERDAIAQFQLKDKPEGRWIQLKNGQDHHRERHSSQSGFHHLFQERQDRRELSDPALRPARAHRRGEELQDHHGRAG